MREGRLPGWAYTVLGIVIIAFLLFPLYWMINASLQPSAALLQTPPALVPQDPTLDGYRAALSTQGSYLVTSLIVASLTVVVTLAISAPAAFEIGKAHV